MSDGTSGRKLGLRVLVVEDESLIAIDIEWMLARLGIAIGPVPTVNLSLSLLQREEPDVAILNVELRREWSTPVAEALRARGIPFALATACSRSELEIGFGGATILDKPVDLQLLDRLLTEVARSTA